MRVKIIKSHNVQPKEDDRGLKSTVLPAIDSWYAQWRTLVPIYLFDGYTGGDLHSELLQSFSQTINAFPQLAGTLAPCIINGAVDGDGDPLQRVKLVWGGVDEVGAEFIEASTKARVQSLLKPDRGNSSGFMWDRSEDSSLKPLFPQTTPSRSSLRVQVTSFRCGGFSLAVDCDHGLADAYTVALFIQYWAQKHTQMLYPSINCSIPALPDIIFDPEYVNKKLPTVNDIGNGKIWTALLEKARQLPTRRPDLRRLSQKREQAAGPSIALSGQKTSLKPCTSANPSTPTGGPSVDVPYMLHLSGTEYERITRQIQKDASSAHVQVTDQVAIVAFLWAALNRARTHARAGPPLELHLPTSFRWKLGLPRGLIGSPLVAIMMDGSSGRYTDTIALATEITRTLEHYDEDAILAVVYDASLRSSPSISANLGERRQRMEFTSGVASGAGIISFGDKTPIFVGPMFLPVDDLFIMSEGMSSASATFPASLSSKWYRYGVNIFFSTPKDVFKALLMDSALGSLELVSNV